MIRARKRSKQSWRDYIKEQGRIDGLELEFQARFDEYIEYGLDEESSASQVLRDWDNA